MESSKKRAELRGRLVDRQLELAREGSFGLNTRGSTLVGLVATTIALVATLSVRAMRPGQPIGEGFFIALAAVFGLALLALAAAVIVAVSAIRPSHKSSDKLRSVVKALECDSFDESAVHSITWEALDLQRKANDHKADLMRNAYVLTGIGISAVVIATALYSVALRV